MQGTSARVWSSSNGARRPKPPSRARAETVRAVTGSLAENDSGQAPEESASDWLLTMPQPASRKQPSTFGSQSATANAWLISCAAQSPVNGLSRVVLRTYVDGDGSICVEPVSLWHGSVSPALSVCRSGPSPVAGGPGATDGTRVD